MINISKPQIGKEEILAVKEVLESGIIAQGMKTAEFENLFAKYCGTKYAVAFCNGTAAIHAGLHSLGIQPGDEVITTPFTFVATANPILMLGAKVVFCDITEKDFCIDPFKIEVLITKKTKAIIPVDLYGQLYNFKALANIAQKKRLMVLEDACQAVGAVYMGKKAGSLGNAGAFSFYATKNMTTGEGGMLVTDDINVAESSKIFRHHGQNQKSSYEYLNLGYNYRITDIQSAIGLVQLRKIDVLNEKRIKNASILSEGLKSIHGLILPSAAKGNRHVYHQYTIRVLPDFKYSRDNLLDYLKKQGINAGVYYPKPLHLHKHFSALGYKEGDFPIAELLARQVLSLPVHPGLTNRDLLYIVKAFKNLVS